MKKWRETQSVLRTLVDLKAAGQRAALATVVRVRGSAYRREGAKLLVAEDGSTTGNVSGGCLEQDVKETALQVIAFGQPRMRKYCSGSDDIGAWDMGMGCDGQVEIFVEPAGEWSAMGARLDKDEAFAICSVAGGDAGAAPLLPGRLIVSGSGEREGTLGDRGLDAMAAEKAWALVCSDGESGLHGFDGREVFVDVFQPPPRLVIVGAGEDARPLARLAAEAGFNVSVIDRRPALLTTMRFPPPAQLIESEAQQLVSRMRLDKRSYVVLMTHNFADDREYLAALLPTPVNFIGLLGPRQRTVRMLDALEVRDPADFDRIHAPVGLDLGGEGAEQVALAIVGEILATRASRRPLPLRERVTPIHGRDH
jgi:xanthine dehydrogenase accessory factor